MAGPYDYSINVPNPVAGFLQGVQVGQAVRQQETERLQAEQKKQLEAAFLKDIRGAIQNPVPERWQELYAKHPMMYEQISAIRKGTAPATANLFTNTALKVLQFDALGDVEGAAKQAEDAAAAATAGGMTEEAQKLTDMATTYRRMQADPTQRRGAVAGLLAVYAPPEQYDRISKVYGFDMPAPLAEYQARLRKDGKEAADTWWKLESGKFLTTDDAFINVEEYLKRGGPITGAPAPKGVTFTPVKASEGGQTAKPSGNFQGK